MKGDIIDFDFEQMQGMTVRKILGNMPIYFDDGGVSFDKVMLKTEKSSIVFYVDKDTDEVFCRKEDIITNFNDDEIWIDIEDLKEYIGYELGWLWTGRNWMGYADMMTLSFSGIDPNIALVGIASKLSIYRLHKVAG